MDEAVSMTNAQQQAPSAAWLVAPGRVQALHIGAARVLRVCEGPLWLTTRGRGGRPGVDLWLDAGDECRLPPGADVVVEGWPQARFQLLVPPPAPRRSLRAALSAWWSGARRRAAPVAPAA